MKKPKDKQKIIAIVGPTASGKSDLAITIAKRFHGEIISADSRQVYKGMDIGSGKVTGKWKTMAFSSHPERSEGSQLKSKDLVFISEGVPHYGIDIASPKRQYSVAQFKKYAQGKIDDIASRGKLPIICGGTGHWVDALLLNQQLPEVKPNLKLRKELEKKSTDELFTLLKKKDPKRAKTIDAKNPRRLIRALEIISATGAAVPPLARGGWPKAGRGSQYDATWIGILPPFDILESKIKTRLTERIKQGMLKEMQRLHNEGLAWKRLESFGLEYKYGALLLQKKMDRETFEQKLYTEIRRYSKRQLTWFKRNQNINWVKNASEAIEITKRDQKNH